MKYLPLSSVTRAYARLAGVTLSLVALSASAMPIQPLTPGDEPALTQAGYEQTPFGFVHKSCVFEVKDGEVVDATDGKIVHVDKSVSRPAHCGYPLYRHAATSAKAQPLPATNGWVENVNWTAPAYITRLYAAWHAPTYPTQSGSSGSGGQLLYFFPGTEPSVGGDIYQPVLSYGYNSANYEISSWYVGPNVYHSKFQAIPAGAGIIGTITGSSCTSTGTCTYVVTTNAWTERKSVSVTVRGGGAQRWVFGGVVEVYNVTSCDQMPASRAIQFYSIGLWHGATKYTPAWSNGFGNGLPAPCSRKISSSPSVVNLKW